ncbi:MAG: hypothetical protein ACK5YR_12345 [Pirellula sp.]|jgi:hypothetical protein
MSVAELVFISIATESHGVAKIALDALRWLHRRLSETTKKARENRS